MGIFGKLKTFRKKQEEEQEPTQPSAAEQVVTMPPKGSGSPSVQRWEATTSPLPLGENKENHALHTSTTSASDDPFGSYHNMMSAGTNDHDPTSGQALHPDDEISIASGASENQIRAWDEGGSSDCGYSESLHNMFMCVGGGVHSLVGAPSDGVHSMQKSIGNWFQELSYATRDILRGDGAEGMQEDAIKAVGTFVLGEDINTTNNLLNDPLLDGGAVALAGPSSTAAMPQQVQ
jgi:hypothetical protein